MSLSRSGPDWQRRVLSMRRSREFIPPQVQREGEGYRTEVFEVVCAPEIALWWVDLTNGQWRLPPQLREWAAFVEQELPARFDVDPLYPFFARFGRCGSEYLVDMENPG